MRYNLSVTHITDHHTTASEAIAQFYAGRPLRTLEAGQLLLVPGDTVPPVTLLESGVVLQYQISDNGTRQVLNFFKQGAFFPANAAINQTPASYYFEALTDITYRQASAQAVDSFLRSHPEVLYDLTSRLYRGMDGLLSKLAHALSESADSRILNELSIHAARFGTHTQGGVEIPLTGTALAEQTGLTRETVSRELGKLKQAGIVATGRGTITLLDAADA